MTSFVPKVSGSQLIAGATTREGTEQFTSVNPRTMAAGAIPFVGATIGEVDRAVQAASAAFEQTRRFSPARLAAFLDTVADEIEALGEELISTADFETALGVTRLRNERERTLLQLGMFAELLRKGSYVEAIIDSSLPDRQPMPRPSIQRMLTALGPVAVFSASNFPFAFSVAGGDTASAFAAGCPVIVKGHPSHPATSELTAWAITRAVTRSDFPPGFFSCLQGNSIAVGQALVQHPGIAAVGFTGSTAAGRAIFNSAAGRPSPIPVYAEMGSVNPVVILPGALRNEPNVLAADLVTSLTLGAGQFCTNPGLIFMLAGPETEAFVADVARRMDEQESGTLLNGQIAERLAQTVAATKAVPTVHVCTTGSQGSTNRFHFENTIMQATAATFIREPQLQEEHFGPVSLFVIASSSSELLTAISTLHGMLTGSIHAAPPDHELASQLLDLLQTKVGRLIWNGFPTGVEVCHAMQHGGPYPATTAPATTSVGLTAIKRFMRPVAYQNVPDQFLPPALQEANPLQINRIVDNEWVLRS